MTIPFDILVGLLTAAAVFIHGQANATIRIICTIVVTLCIRFAFERIFVGFPIWTTSIVAGSTVWAFCWGPEIGWSVSVRNTQALKALWLTVPLFPFGLPYIVLRPLAYWIGYVKFVQNWDRSDQIARAISGVSLGIIVTVAVLVGGKWLG